MWWCKAAPIRPGDGRRTGALRRAALAVALAATLASCGFGPSGPPKLPFQSLYISAPAYSSFAAELKRYIASGGQGKLAAQAKEADVVLDIFGEATEAQILSLTATGRVAEFQLRYRVSYRLHDNANKEWIPSSEIRVRRDYTYDDQAVLAKENEQNLLFQAMRDDAVRQMMRRLSHARPPAPPQ
jgi:LPS-assembly lipoprotein